MATFAWRLVADDALPRAPGALGEQHMLQLKGVFLHFDDDKDGYLTTAQLTDAVASLGFPSREKLIQKFATSTKALQTATFKTDFHTFSAVIDRELQQLKRADQDLAELFAFMDVNRSGHLTRRDIKHLLCEVDTATPLAGTELTRFLRGLRFSSDSDRISIVELRRQLLFNN